MPSSIPLFFALLCLLGACAPGQELPQRPPAPPQASAQPGLDPNAPPPPLPQAAPQPQAELVDTLPRGEAQTDAVIKVRFSQPVIPLAAIDEQDAEGLLRLDPALPAQAAWLSPDTLTLTPDKHLPRAQTFTVSTTPKLAALLGHPLSVQQWTFHTPAPSLVHSEPPHRARDIEPDASLWLVFDQAIDPAQLQQHLSLRSLPWDAPEESYSAPTPQAEALAFTVTPRARKPRNEQPLPWRVRSAEPGQAFQIKPVGRWPLDRTLLLTVPAGLVGQEGPRPSAQPQHIALRTPGALKLEDGGCPKSDPCLRGSRAVRLRWNNPIDPGSLRHIQVQPQPKDLKIYLPEHTQAHRQVLVEGLFEADTPYTITAQPGLRDTWGQALATEARWSPHFKRPLAEVELLAESGVLPQHQGARVGMETRHLARAAWNSSPLPPSQLLELVQAGVNPLDPGQLAQAHLEHSGLWEEMELRVSGDSQWSGHQRDLASRHKQPYGAAWVSARGVETTSARHYALPQEVHQVYQWSNLGVSAAFSMRGVHLRVLDLKTTRGVPGVEVELWRQGQPPRKLGRSDAQGLLKLEGLAQWERPSGAYLFLHQPANKDRLLVSIHSLQQHGWYWGRDPLQSLMDPSRQLHGELLTERGVYKPGEPIYLVGWTGVEDHQALSSLSYLPAGTSGTLTLTDPSHQEIARRPVRLSQEGKLHVELELPRGARLGTWGATVQLDSPGLQGELHARFKVEDYRAPAFEVSAHAQHPEVLDGQPNPVRVAASYYFGGPVQLDQVRSRLLCQPAVPALANLEPGWSAGRGARDRRQLQRPDLAPRLSPAQRKQGRFTLQPVGSVHEDRQPLRCQQSVVVQDPSLQEVGAQADFLVHPASRYVAARMAQPTEYAGSRTRLELRGVDWAGAASDLPGAVQVQAQRSWSEPVYAQHGKHRYIARWRERRESFALCHKKDLKAAEVASCGLLLKEGHYEITLSATVEGKKTHTELSFYVYPKRWRHLGQQSEELSIEVPRATMRLGDAVPVVLRSPQPLHGMLLVMRGGLRQVHPFQIDNSGQATVTLRTDEGWAPRIHLKASAWAPGEALHLPQTQEASAQLQMDSAHRRLQVTLEAPARANPGQEVQVQVQVQDHKQRPVQGRVTLWAVDEAVLSLTRYQLPDLVESFLLDQDEATALLHSDDLLRQAYVLPSEDPRAWGMGGLGASGSGMGGGGAAHHGVGSVRRPATPRAKFKTTPLFLGDAALDKQGRARATVSLPDNLTTFRLIAVASDKLEGLREPGRFGHGERPLRVDTPLVVRAAAPRHLRPGDAAHLAAVITHKGEQPGQLAVTLALAGDSPALRLTGETQRSLEVQPQQTLRVPFALLAQAPGSGELLLEATFTPQGQGQPQSDALLFEVPVQVEPTLIEKVATYGTLDSPQAISLPVQVPQGALPGHGGLSVEVSGSLLGGLAESARGLLSYPYGCAEQTSSRLLPLIAFEELRSLLQLPQAESREMALAGIERLLSMQTAEGGFGYWPGAQRPHPFVSGYVTWILWMAQRAGLPVPQEALDKALGWLQGQTRQPEPSWSGALLYQYDTRRAMSAFVLAQAGRPVPEAMTQLWQARQQLPLFARGFLLMALHHTDAQDPRSLELATELLGLLQETPGGATTTEKPLWSLEEEFHSDARSDAVVLMALMATKPTHPTVVKLARGLMQRRRGGVWRNTQENAWALLALSGYARRYEAQEPDMQVEATAGPTPVLSLPLRGRQAPPGRGALSMEALLKQADKPQGATVPLVLQRSGQGRAYYRVELAYAPQGDQLPARQRGLKVERALRTAQGPLTSGQALEPGQILAMDITLEARGRTHYVAVDAPLPAGLEPIQTHLGGPTLLPMPGQRGLWVSHQELHRDRALLFADDLPPGRHTHTVYLRATTPGRYAFPPTQAEAMYAPEVFGRTEGAQLSIKDNH